MYDGDDPLATWDQCPAIFIHLSFRFIKWTSQTASSASMKDELTPLFIECIRTFFNDGRYSNDPRFLHICIRYVVISRAPLTPQIDSLDDPIEMFRQLQARDLFQDLALFYVSWAFILEHKRGNVDEAMKKLDEGIAR